MNPFNAIGRLLTVVFVYIFNLTSYAVRRLRFSGQGIPIEDKLSDVVQIIRSTFLFFLFNLLALFVFTVLPQGKDIILIVIEDLRRIHVGSLLSLLVGLLGWCIVSEFGARYKIYVTDNSGLSFSAERVAFRKEAQKFASSIYLLLPVIIVIISVVVVSLDNITKWGVKEVLPFAAVLLLLILALAGLTRFYLDPIFVARLRKKEVWFKVKEEELRWANKLYGIYNDYVIMVRKSTNFKDDKPVSQNDPSKKDLPPDLIVSNTYKRFTSLIEDLDSANPTPSDNTIENFPQNYLKEAELPPAEFGPADYRPLNKVIEDNPARIIDKKAQEFIFKENEDGYYRWIYQNNPGFYKTLHLQIKVIAISSFVFMLLVSWGRLTPYDVIGSPALVCLSFACWLGIYTGLLYIDSRYRRNFRVSVRFLLLIWFIIVSFINLDHPVRDSRNGNVAISRPELTDHFQRWINHYRSARNTGRHSMIRLEDSSYSDANHCHADSPRNSTAGKDTVYFITAEGGALRTGAFTALLLAHLQDSLPNFKNRIFAYSSVSGGSVGIGMFNAIAYLESDSIKKRNQYQELTKNFFVQDQLSAPVAKLFYGDLLNDFWPAPIEAFDRAIALEKAWESSYYLAYKGINHRNIFASDFMSLYAECDSSRILPAWFINTTEVETGLQCFLSNVKPDSFPIRKERDLFDHKIHHAINYSTAINFSSRFPLFSPSAALYQNDDQTYHYIDGGYVENTGSKTMLEIIQELHSLIKRNNVVPCVLQIRYSDEDSLSLQHTGFLNEISSIVNGIYNTRAGCAKISGELLRREVVDNLGGMIIRVPLPSTSNEVPMSWVFSERSMTNLSNAVEGLMKDPKSELLKLPDFPVRNQ